MKLNQDEFSALVDIALATRDEAYFKELLHKQENALFQEIEPKEIDVVQRDLILAQYEKMCREVHSVLLRQFNNVLHIARMETEDEIKGRFELVSDTISDVLICNYLDYENILKSQNKRLPAPEEEEGNEHI